MLKKGARGDGLCTPSGQQLPAHFRWTMCDLEPIFAKTPPLTRCPPSLRLGSRLAKHNCLFLLLVLILSTLRLFVVVRKLFSALVLAVLLLDLSDGFHCLFLNPETERTF